MANDMIPSDNGSATTQQPVPPTTEANPPVQQSAQPAPGPTQQPASASPAQAGAGATQSTPAAPGAPKQPGSPQQAPVGVPAPLQGAAATHPSIQRAGVLRSIAQTLAGGPRYNYTVDANTGTMNKTEVPMSRKDIGLAIALEAVSGSLTGLAQKGPGGAFKGGEQAFQQSQQQVTQQDQQAKATADQDLARHYQVLETNLKMYNTAQQAGRMDVEDNEKYVGQFSDALKTITENAPQILKGVVTEQDMAKYHVTKDTAIPFRVVPLLDPTTGQQVVKNGVKLSQLEYQVVDPNYKATLFTPDKIKEASDLGLPWAKALMASGKDGQPPQDIATTVSFWLNCMAQLSSIELGQTDLANYYAKLNEGATANPSKATQAPTIPNSGASAGIQPRVDSYAKKYGVPEDFARALIFRESGGDPNAKGKNTTKGQAKGLGQLMPDTVAKYGVQDPFNPDQNLDATMHKFSDLLKKYNNDPVKAYASYYGGESRFSPDDSIPDILKKFTKPDDRDAIKKFASSLGINVEGGAGNGPAYKVPDLKDAIKSDPTTADAWSKFTYLLNQTASQNDGKVSYQKAYAELAMGGNGRAPNPTAAAKILNLLGGQKAMQDFDQQEAIEEAQRKAQIEITTDQTKQENKNASDAQSTQDLSDVLTGPADFKYTPDMSGMNQKDLQTKLQSEGVTTPENFSALYSVGNYMANDADFANRQWKKGDQSAMRRDEAMTYIRNFINPNFNETDYENIRQKRKDLTNANSTDYQQMKSFNTLFDHLGDALNKVNQLRNTNSPIINTPLNSIKTNVLGMPGVVETMAAIEPVKKEFMTFLLNNHALTEDDKKQGDDLLSMHFSLAQLQGVLKQFADTAAYRLLEVNGGWQRLTGNNVPGLISPTALRTISMLPDVADTLKDMDVGGTFVGSGTYNGKMGQSVGQRLGLQAKPPVPGAVKSSLSDGTYGWLGPDGTIYDMGGQVRQGPPQKPQAGR